MRTYHVAVDEAGRGSWAGPLVVGAVAIPLTGHPAAPDGLTDSKRLTAKRRTALEGPVQDWAHAWGVGMVSAAEVDDLGVTLASRLAGHRALTAVWATVAPETVAEILLDGVFDYLTGLTPGGHPQVEVPMVRTQPKADLTDPACSGASVLAKVAHDRVLADLDLTYPGYGWAKNQGYPTPPHAAAVAALGLSPAHRRTWGTPGRSTKVQTPSASRVKRTALPDPQDVTLW